MFKTILALIIGIGVGGAAGFFAGADRAEKIQKEILKTEQESFALKFNECKDEKAKIEGQIKTITTELQLNESRPGYVTTAILKAPMFSPPDLETLTSDKHGDVKLIWSPVKGAKQYIVTIEDTDGKIITTVDVEGEPSIYLNRVPHSAQLSNAEYFVRIATVNGLDKAGQPGPRKPVHFAKQSFKVNKRQKIKKLK